MPPLTLEFWVWCTVLMGGIANNAGELWCGRGGGGWERKQKLRAEVKTAILQPLHFSPTPFHTHTHTHTLLSVEREEMAEWVIMNWQVCQPALPIAHAMLSDNYDEEVKRFHFSCTFRSTAPTNPHPLPHQVGRHCPRAGRVLAACVFKRYVGKKKLNQISSHSCRVTVKF